MGINCLFILNYSSSLHYFSEKCTPRIGEMLYNFERPFTNIPNVYIKAGIKVCISNVSEEALRRISPLICVSWYHFVQYDDVTHLVIGKAESISMAYLIALLKGVYIVEDTCKKYRSFHG